MRNERTLIRNAAAALLPRPSMAAPSALTEPVQTGIRPRTALTDVRELREIYRNVLRAESREFRYASSTLADMADSLLLRASEGKTVLSNEQKARLYELQAREFPTKEIAAKNIDLSPLGKIKYDCGGGCHAPGYKIDSGNLYPTQVYSVLVGLPKQGEFGRAALLRLAQKKHLNLDYALLAEHALAKMENKN